MVPERIYLPDCRRRTELRARYRNDCRIVTLRPEKGFQQTELTVEDPVGRMDIREEMEMANRTVVHKSRRRGICIVLREVTIVLIGMGMQAFARIGREQDQQQRPRIEYPYEFLSAHFRCKNNEKRLPGKVHTPKYLYIGMLLQGIKYQYLESQTYPFPRV